MFKEFFFLLREFCESSEIVFRLSQNSSTLDLCQDVYWSECFDGYLRAFSLPRYVIIKTFCEYLRERWI